MYIKHFLVAWLVNMRHHLLAFLNWQPAHESRFDDSYFFTAPTTLLRFLSQKGMFEVSESDERNTKKRCRNDYVQSFSTLCKHA